MADLGSTKIYGKLTVLHEAILKANATLTGNIDVTGSITGGTFVGDGAAITNLDASSLASGTVPEARLPASALVGDTTYSAGTGISLAGTTFSLADEAYTSAEKSKLSGIESGAQVNDVTSVAGRTGAVTLDTNDVSEGTNLYHTDARARGAISVSGDLSYDTGTGVISFNETYSTAGEVKTAYESNANTNAYTDSEKSKLGGIASGAEVNTVDSVAGKTGAVTLNSDDVSEGSNLYFTNTRVRDAISVSGDLSYNNLNGTISFNETYSTDTELLNGIKNVDGSGSGLDADTVDGLEASQFLRSDVPDVHTIGNVRNWPNAIVSDPEVWNSHYVMKWDAGNNAIALITDSSTNARRWGIQSGHDSSAYGDVFGTLDLNPFGGAVYINGNIAWHAGSDGSGSGLDADTVDGIEASQFIRSDADDSVSGTITFGGAHAIASASTSLSTTTQTALATFPIAAYGSGKMIIQALDTVTGERHITELLVIHDGTTASATEYGTIHTGANPLATYDVDISGSDLRILTSNASTNSTEFKVMQQLMVT